MIVSPPTRRTRPRPVALVTPGHRSITITTIDGATHHNGAEQIYAALDRHSGHVLYTNGAITHFRHTTGAKVWQGSTWRGRTVHMTLDGTKVKIHPLRGTLEGSPDPFLDLVNAITWLGGHGVSPASISSMGWALWRSTLTRDLRISCPPVLGRSALYGGRQGIRDVGTHTYQHMVAADITAAYPWSMAARPYALSLRQVSTTTALDPTVAGIVTGTVVVEDLTPYPPVPQRVAADMIWFPTGPVAGSWSWAEAAAAQSLGHQVNIEKCYAPVVESDLFGAWWELVREGRELPGRASTLVKGCANSLWGMFGMRGDNQGVLRWDDDAGNVARPITNRAQKLPHAMTAHIAAETASRVRVRMLLEGCGDHAAAGHPVHIDTDGIIIRKRAVAGMTKVAVPGEWRQKTVMRKVEIRAPQVYRYQCGAGCGIDHRPWHYSVAGVPADRAEKIFDGVGQRGISVSFNGTDMVLPGSHVFDGPGKARALALGMSAKEMA
jgi:hypothetical protein